MHAGGQYAPQSSDSSHSHTPTLQHISTTVEEDNMLSVVCTALICTVHHSVDFLRSVFGLLIAIHLLTVAHIANKRHAVMQLLIAIHLLTVAHIANKRHAVMQLLIAIHLLSVVRIANKRHAVM